MKPSAAGLPVLLLLAIGCASPVPGTKSEEPARSVVRTSGFQAAEFLTEGDRVHSRFPDSPAEVWAVLPAVYERLGIPVAKLDEERMTLGNQALKARSIDGKRMSTFVDCGTTLSGRVADRYDVTLNLATQVAEAPGGGSEIVTSLDAWAEPRLTRGDAVHCRSRGALEEQISAMTSEELREGTDRENPELLSPANPGKGSDILLPPPSR